MTLLLFEVCSPQYVDHLKSPVVSIQYVFMLNIFTEVKTLDLTSFLHLQAYENGLSMESLQIGLIIK